MERREAMKRVAALMGASLSASTLMVFQQSCNADPRPEPGVFSKQDAELLNQIGEIIIPETDSPGAAAAGTGPFAVKMLEDCYPPEARQKVIAFLSHLTPDFEGESHENQVGKIKEIDHITYGDNNTENNERYEGYKIVKELTLFGYFTSEPGATQALKYVKVPGRYEGCIDLDPDQKAWA